MTEWDKMYIKGTLRVPTPAETPPTYLEELAFWAGRVIAVMAFALLGIWSLGDDCNRCVGGRPGAHSTDAEVEMTTGVKTEIRGPWPSAPVQREKRIYVHRTEPMGVLEFVTANPMSTPGDVAEGLSVPLSAAKRSLYRYWQLMRLKRVAVPASRAGCTQFSYFHPGYVVPVP